MLKQSKRFVAIISIMVFIFSFFTMVSSADTGTVLALEDGTTYKVLRTITNCDTQGSIGHWDVTTAAGEFKEGTGALKRTASDHHFNVTDFDKLGDGASIYSSALMFDLYIENPALITGDGQIELRPEEATDDSKELTWNMTGNGHFDFKAGWNKVIARFEGANLTGSWDLKDIKYFRIYSGSSASQTMIIDDIKIINLDEHVLTTADWGGRVGGLEKYSFANGEKKEGRSAIWVGDGVEILDKFDTSGISFTEDEAYFDAWLYTDNAQILEFKNEGQIEIICDTARNDSKEYAIRFFYDENEKTMYYDGRTNVELVNGWNHIRVPFAAMTKGSDAANIALTKIKSVSYYHMGEDATAYDLLRIVKGESYSGRDELQAGTPGIPETSFAKVADGSITKSGVKLSWGKQEGFTAYKIRQFKEVDGAWIFDKNIEAGNVSEITVNGLDAETKYRFQLVANNTTLGRSSIYEPVDITTLDEQGNPPTQPETTTSKKDTTETGEGKHIYMYIILAISALAFVVVMKMRKVTKNSHDSDNR